MYRPDGIVVFVVPLTQTKILDCAERIALRDGVARLTIDAVAAEAGLSKGGVLYNFPSKESLIRGMVARLIGQTEAEMARLVKDDAEPKGRMLRAWLGVSFPEHGTAPAHVNQVAAVLLTAILTDPALLEPAREHFRQTLERLEQDGVDPAVMHIVRLATDGLWLADCLGMPGPAPEVRRAVIERMYEMTRR